jgi:dTDP-4-dehydrorhamnose reductase
MRSTTTGPILLFGASGKLGWELQRALAPLGEVSAPTRAQADFTRPETLAAVVHAARPRWIVNAAAYTDVDRAESEPALAQRINADAPAALAHAARVCGAALLHFSTDQVFDDAGDAPIAEHAPTGAPNAYGASKLAGEERVAASGCRYLTLRVAWLHGPRGKNFVRLMAQQALAQQTMQVVDDQFGAPTPAALVADVAAHLLRAQAEGVYHVAASGAVSRHALACGIVDWLRARGLPLRVREVRGVSSEARATPARRPRNARLDTRAVCAHYGLVMPPWQPGVERTLEELHP